MEDQGYNRLQNIRKTFRKLGTCGWHPYPWAVQYIRARSASEAVFKATKR
jgi:hypothetical protein